MLSPEKLSNGKEDNLALVAQSEHAKWRLVRFHRCLQFAKFLSKLLSLVREINFRL